MCDLGGMGGGGLGGVGNNDVFLKMLKFRQADTISQEQEDLSLKEEQTAQGRVSACTYVQTRRQTLMKSYIQTKTFIFYYITFSNMHVRSCGPSLRMKLRVSVNVLSESFKINYRIYLYTTFDRNFT